MINCPTNIIAGNRITAYITNAMDPFGGQIILTPVENDPYLAGNMAECFVDSAIPFQTEELPAESEDAEENHIEAPSDPLSEVLEEEIFVVRF